MTTYYSVQIITEGQLDRAETFATIADVQKFVGWALDESEHAGLEVQVHISQCESSGSAAADVVAWDRDPTDSCERGTPGCSVHHTRDSECQTW
jgi:hypothetical protein